MKAAKFSTAANGSPIPGDCYMKPCLATAKPDFEIVKHETFGPLLYLMTYRDFDEAIAIQNGVPQGLTSSIFTNDVREAEKFVSAVGSDCGIANVNTGTSGAEIGGAFGGEKNTGGGRESGSDCWKSYMRRQTNTINFSTELPLGAGNPVRRGRRKRNGLTAVPLEFDDWNNTRCRVPNIWATPSCCRRPTPPASADYRNPALGCRCHGANPSSASGKSSRTISARPVGVGVMSQPLTNCRGSCNSLLDYVIRQFQLISGTA